MDTLFHYTTAAGLLGILESSTFWATDLRFLNDAQEAVYAHELLVDAVRFADNPALQVGHSLHHIAEEFGADFDRYKRLVAEELSSLNFPIYVTCFCESGDLLSQWRAYGSDHGYAIEVKRDALKTAVQQIAGSLLEGVGLTQVQYGSKAAADLVSAAMQDMSRDTNLGHVGVHAHLMALRLAARLAGVKHPGFQEEREWRLVAAFEYGFEEHAKFRSTPMAIVPYIEVHVPKDAIAAIRVGPGRHVDIREAGVRRLLHKVDCEASVVHSEVPLRV
jgi:hypothetical protein